MWQRIGTDDQNKQLRTVDLTSGVCKNLSSPELQEKRNAFLVLRFSEKRRSSKIGRKEHCEEKHDEFLLTSFWLILADEL